MFGIFLKFFDFFYSTTFGRFLQMAALKQQLILTKFNRPGNIKGVAGFKKQTELYPYKCRSKSPALSTFTFNRLSNSNVKVLTICLGLWCLC